MVTKTILVFLFVGSKLPSFSDGIFLARILAPFFNWANIFDPPVEEVQKLQPTNHVKPTLERMKYFNNFCAASYCGNNLNDLSCSFCKKFKKDVDEHKVFTNKVTQCSAFVTVSKKYREIVVTFRGSDHKVNFMLNAFVTEYHIGDGMKVHSGFHIATKSLFKQVSKYVRSKKNKKYKIVVAGHSLGGVMARLTLFYWLYLNTFPNAEYELYTYGEPRAGNEKYAEFMDRQHITSARIVNGADIVPHLYTTKMFNFVHSRLEFWAHGGYGTFCNQTVREDPKCSNSLGPLYSVADHSEHFNVNYYESCA